MTVCVTIHRVRACPGHTRLRLRRIVDLAGLLQTVCVAILVGCSREQRTDSQTVFEAREWQGLGGALYLRSHSTQPGSILLRLNSHGSIYAYDGTAGRIHKASMDDWNRSIGTEIQCDSACGPLEPFVFRREIDTVQFEGRAKKTAGSIVLSVCADSAGELIAVLSAEGPRGLGPLVPFLGGSRGAAQGKRFHQVFERSTGKEVGKVVILPFGARAHVTGPCWSRDGSLVVYHGRRSSLLVILKRPEHGLTTCP